MEKENTLSEAIQSETKFASIKDHKIAYRSIGKGLPMILRTAANTTLPTLPGSSFQRHWSF